LNDYLSGSSLYWVLIVLQYKHDCKLTLELLDTEMEEPEPVAETEKWSSYVERYANSGVDGVAGSNSGAVAAEGTEHPDHRTETSADEADDVSVQRCVKSSKNVSS
jgi:hypothetical protein